MYHYVYKITNLNPLGERKYYIGVRSSECDPEKDVNYWGSSLALKKEINERGNHLFKKDILGIFNTREKAFDEEILFVSSIVVQLDVVPGLGNLAFLPEESCIQIYDDVEKI
jgi:hypothetical protein